MYFAPRSRRKLDYFSEYGWGYADTRFDDTPDGYSIVTGNRYSESNKKLLTFR